LDPQDIKVKSSGAAVQGNGALAQHTPMMQHYFESESEQRLRAISLFFYSRFEEI
jgi:hypothetical protein